MLDPPDEETHARDPLDAIGALLAGRSSDTRSPPALERLHSCAVRQFQGVKAVSRHPAHSRRLLVTGASGAGTTTLGRALAERWSVPHAEVDDYFWVPTSPAYTEKRPADERLSLMRSVFVPRDSWILSGSVMGWGDSLIADFNGVVFLSVDPAIRMARLETRETVRYGEVDEAAQREFLDWARGYDNPDFPGRSRASHDRWLATLPCPVLRLDGADPVPRLVDSVTAWLDSPAVNG